MRHIFYFVVILAISVGILFPRLGIYFKIIPFLVGVTLFCNFLDVKVNFRRILRKEMVVTLLLSALVMPIISYHLISMGLSDPYRVGVLLVSCAPTGVMGLILANYIPESDYDLVLGNFLFLTFAAIFYIPIVLSMLLEHTIEVHVQSIIGQTIVLLVLPYTLSRLVIRFKLMTASTSRLISDAIMLVCLFLVIAITISGAWRELSEVTELVWLSLSVFAVYLLHALLGYSAGLLISTRSVSKTLAFVCSTRNTQLVLAIGALNFSSTTLVPIVLAIFFHHFTNALWLWIFRKVGQEKSLSPP